jgi:hypothetical protein
MKNKLFFLLLACVWLAIGNTQAQKEESSSQKEPHKVHHLGLSIPMIWNNSSGVYYSVGNRKEPEGGGLSYGINLNYSKSIYKKLFGVLGAGYFKQVFGIGRPIDYDTGGPEPLIYSRIYAYNSFHFFVGLGYKQVLNHNLALKGQITYNLHHSFRQKYTPTNTNFGENQINKNSFGIGNMINMNLDIEKRVSKKISAGIGIVFPILTQWDDDKIFYELGYTDDEQKIAYNKFSIGTNIFCNYNF